MSRSGSSSSRSRLSNHHSGHHHHHHNHEEKKPNHLHQHSADELEDLKAAFVFINNGVDGHFNSAEDLAKALRGCGKNPTQRNIDIYWKSHKSKASLF
jgi:Ca2+-binding EF-hand superfamily protein